MYTTIIAISILSTLFLGVAWLSKDKIERLLFFIGTYLLKGDAQSKVALIAPTDNHTLLNANGDLVSYIQLKGARRLIGQAEFDSLSEAVGEELASKMRDGSGKQHEFSFMFLSDPSASKDRVKFLLAPSRSTAKRMDVAPEATIWFDEKEKLLDYLCNDEVMLMSVTTLRSGSLNKADNQRYAAWVADLRKKVRESLSDIGISSEEIIENGYAQPVLPLYGQLKSRHEAVVDSFVERLSKLQVKSNENKEGANSSDSLMGIQAEAIPVDLAIYYAKRVMRGGRLPMNWRPRLLNSPNGAAGSTLRRKGDLGNMLPIPIARQIFTEPLFEGFHGIEYVESEGMYYASIKTDVFSTKAPAPSFNDLALSIGKEFPFTFTVEVLPDGMGEKTMDQFFAGFFGGFGEHNRLIKEAWEELKERNALGQYIAAQRAIFTTWADSLQSLNDNLSFLRMMVQSWGGTTVSNQSGAPLDLLVSSFPALSRSHVAPITPAPMEAISRQIPIYRTASPWDQGQLILRTESGVPYPIAFGSTKQSAWGTLVFAPPGRGKSFLMNTLNAGLFFSAGIRDLPYITIIDKGMSSANVVEMAKGLLPEHKKHQAISIRLRNTAEYAINIFDTQLGLDFPTERERSSQINMLSAISVGLGDAGAAFLGQVIDESFRALGRYSLQAKRWQNSFDAQISVKLRDLGVDLSDDNKMPRIWEVVDILFDQGEINLATRAQRFAVPVMGDLISAASSTVVRDLYQNTVTPGGEKIIEVFIRSVTTAAKEYALLSTYTRFDIGDARVVAIDLEEILSNTGSEEGAKKAALMMMFARQLGAKNYFLKWEGEMETIVPERYKKYHEARIKVMFETLKFIEYDEFHNANGMDSVVREVKTDFREGRKYNVVPLLSSQLFTDFDQELVDVANNFFILGVGSEKAAQYIQTVFHLSDSERATITNKCLGPTSKGAPLLGIFKTNDGMVSELLYNSASKLEQWAFNSSAVDTSMRKELTKALNGNYWLSLKGLAHYFPKGTARFDVEELKQNASDHSGADEDGYVATLARSTALKIQKNLMI